MTDDPLQDMSWGEGDEAHEARDKLLRRAVGTRYGKRVKMITDDVDLKSNTQDKSKAKVHEDYLKLLQAPMMLGGCDDQDEIDIAFAMLYAQAPWCRDPLTAMWRASRTHVVDNPYYFCEPILLHGAPGCGKTYLAQMIAQQMNLPYVRLNMAQLTGVFELTGHEMAWSGANVGAPLALMLNKRQANPVVILDEVDKCGRPATNNGGDPQNAILALTDPTGRDAWRCPFLQTEVYMGAINYVMTANDIDKVPAPLRDRCRVFEIKRPFGDDLRQFIETSAAGLDAAIIDVLFDRAKGGESLRSINRAIKVARDVKNIPFSH